MWLVRREDAISFVPCVFVDLQLSLSLALLRNDAKGLFGPFTSRGKSSMQ